MVNFPLRHFKTIYCTIFCVRRESLNYVTGHRENLPEYLTRRRQNIARIKEDWAEALGEDCIYGKELSLCGQNLVLPDNQLSWLPECPDSEMG